ncbi:unnamed protein product [Dovyalis caffra]|uniref:Uncharacterized protein n=1 Tax=Dovyalis caffra TaxID=77055 RepID=A0AAV1R244_9ROSI|nr:unnamed protein product [Dovyalis caffra]
MEGMNKGECGVDDWEEFGNGGIDCFSSDYVLPHKESSGGGCRFSKFEQLEQQKEPFLDHRSFEDRKFNVLDPLLPACPNQIAMLREIQEEIEDIVDPKKHNEHPFSSSSLDLLKDYTEGRRRLNIEPSKADLAGKKLSTEEIMRIAGAKFIQSCTRKADVGSMLNNPFDLCFSGLSDEETKNVELAETLLASAEKVGNQQYDRARKLLNQCDLLSSNNGNPVQRVVHYFSEALRKRIDRETGREASQGLESEVFDVDEAVMIPNPTIQACHEGIPFYQVPHFAGTQAIAENMAETKRIHLIDLKIRNGLQWTVLMQALASSRNECPLELLKITAVGTNSKKHIEDTGNRLKSFAQTINIPFSFKIVMVSDMLVLKEDLFELDADEELAIYSEYALKSLIGQPNQLDHLMQFFRSINPCIMVMIEVEANHNSRVFVHRFIETLFYFSAYFDCVDACMEHNDSDIRMVIESIYLGEGIRNIVASEGEERKIRNVKIDVWRKFFAQFGMVETDQSEASLYQANFVIKKFASGSSCTFDMDEKSLLIGWKGTPILSLSTWKFMPQE